ncbi:MAG TPA: hypothetical protein VL307_12650, partial [Chitinophagaceae bacterium]|nr:hypothetical protein [Chitinophagaceae bacterium]
MKIFSLLLTIGTMVNGTAQSQTVPLTAGMKITSSLTITPGNYPLTNGEAPVISIEGDNIIVDFNQAVLDGAAPGSLPDSFRGTAINITGGHNITFRHLSAKGYKVALMAKEVSGLVIEQCDFSYNYRQH